MRKTTTQRSKTALFLILFAMVTMTASAAGPKPETPSDPVLTEAIAPVMSIAANVPETPVAVVEAPATAEPVAPPACLDYPFWWLDSKSVPIPNKTVKLLAADGGVIQTTGTDANGKATFCLTSCSTTYSVKIFVGTGFSTPITCTPAETGQHITLSGFTNP
ncbi:MAG: hypothetical protein JWM20_992 [Patescibacteria group bacterium]|nr:hypothetical protein [Patescibacteria group bacterium]